MDTRSDTMHLRKDETLQYDNISPATPAILFVIAPPKFTPQWQAFSIMLRRSEVYVVLALDMAYQARPQLAPTSGP